MGGKTSYESIKKYEDKAYDKILIRIKPKGKLDTIKAYAAAHGESANSFINNAVDNAMNGVQPTGSPVSASASLVVSEDVARVKAHIEVTGEATEEFIHRAITDTIDRDSVSIKMGISPGKKKGE